MLLSLPTRSNAAFTPGQMSLVRDTCRLYLAARRFVLRRPTSTAQHSSFAATFSIDDLSHLLHYCNAVLAGVPQRELDRVQSVVNAAARLSADARRYDHVIPLLMDLHWLQVPQRIQYKLSVLMYLSLIHI